MNLLLHCCCGPCTVGALPLVLAAGYQPLSGKNIFDVLLVFSAYAYLNF